MRLPVFLLRNLWPRTYRPRRNASAVHDHRSAIDISTGAEDIDGPLTEIGERTSKRLFGEALRQANRALLQTPADTRLLAARGRVYFAWRRSRDAHDDFRCAEALGMRTADIYLHLGWTAFSGGDPVRCEDYLRMALGLEPENFEALKSLAFALKEQDRADESIHFFSRALRIEPDDTECLNGAGLTWFAHQPTEAEHLLRKAIALASDDSLTWSHLGMALALQDRNAEAMRAFERGAELEQRHSSQGDAFANLAIHLGDEGRTAEALACFEKDLEHHVGVNAHVAYAHALLRAGRLAEGWQRYEFRWMVEPGVTRRRNYGVPKWSGQDLQGKTILLVLEQGVGDTFQFIRYAPTLKSLGAHVVMVPGDALWGIAKRFMGVDEIFRSLDQLPKLDYYIPLLSLPGVLGTTLESIPATVPYLHPDPAFVKRWSTRIGAKSGRLRVGLVWAGSTAHKRNRYRSVSLELMQPLLDVPGVEFIALQKECAAPQLKVSGILNLGPELEDWLDTAAVCDSVDLVIAVDTSVAHLAAAMAKSVWMMVPQPPDFRWLENRADTPWYPTMRLFRQQRRGDWKDVVQRMALALDDLVRHGSRVLATSTARSQPKPAAPSGLQSPASMTIAGPRRLAAIAETRYGILEYLPHQEPVGCGLRLYGEHLQHQVELVTRLIAKGSTVIEVGAGVGAHTLALSATVTANGHVYAYEKDLQLRGMCKQNLRANGLTNVTLMRRHLGRAFARSVEPEVVEVGDGSDTLDDLQLARLDLLKVNDLENVADILAGAQESLWILRPKVLVSGCDESSSLELVQRLETFGYRSGRVRSPLHNPSNFNCRADDVYQGQSVLAVLGIAEESDVEIPFEAGVEWT